MNDPLAGLNEQQQNVVLTTHGPVLVLAGAGSGKTRALTHRLAHLSKSKIAKPWELLAVTFTNKAAAQMRQRVAGLVNESDSRSMTISTFHSLGVKILRQQTGFHVRTPRFTILDTKDSEKLVRQALQEQNLPLREWNPAVMRAKISNAKNLSLNPPDIIDRAEGQTDEILGRAYARYEQLLAKNDAYDFDDLLIVPVRMLARELPIRNYYRNLWRFISVDEYQDTNPIQERLLKLLLGKEKNICVVGDDYQAIYSWRGARVDHILQFEKDYPGCKVIYLTQNYRSTPNILQTANCVIAANTNQKHKELWTQAKAGTKVGLAALESDRHEAQWLRRQIEDWQENGGKLKDTAVLYRTNAQSRLFEEEFLTHRLPYTIVGGFRFYDRREVKDALALLNFMVNPNSRLSLERIANSLLSRVGTKTIERWQKEAEKENTTLRDFVCREAERRPQLLSLAKTYQDPQIKNFQGAPVSELLRKLIDFSGYRTWLSGLEDGDERSENIQELLNVASAYNNIDTFLEDTALLSDLDNLEEDQDRITCMTLHAAKGLEFANVYVAGCEEGLLPHTNSTMDQSLLEEERRLLYVGITRAKNRLTLSWAAQRWRAGEMAPQAPSRFLEQLPPEVERMADLPDTQPLWTDTPSAQVSSADPVVTMFNEGEFITHPHFGRGVVISAHGSLVTCVFARHGVKTFDHNLITNSL